MDSKLYNAFGIMFFVVLLGLGFFGHAENKVHWEMKQGEVSNAK